MIFDWFRNKEGDASILMRNIAWCVQALGDVFDLSDQVLLAPIAHAKQSYVASGLTYGHAAWAELYDHLEEYEPAEKMFRDAISQAAKPSNVVIGFELSRAQRRLLEQTGQRFLDLRLHPVRFLTDYHFAAASNDPDLHARLRGLAPERAYLDHHVDRIMAQAAPEFDAAYDSVLFAQTAIDASRIRDGLVLDDLFVAHHIAKAMAANPAKLHLKAHPHELASMLLPGRATHAASYDILSVPDLPIFALSSSIVHEAQYFPARAVAFLEPQEQFARIGEPGDPGTYHMLPANFQDPALWTHILTGAARPDLLYSTSEAPYKFASGMSWG